MRGLNTRNPSIIISYIALRRLIGIFGILLPFICMLGGYLFAHFSIEPSISYYYHTNMRDFLVGLLCGVSMFLMCYKGYLFIDTVVNFVSGVASLGIALFPCLIDKMHTDPVGIFQLNPILSDTVHFVCAAIFFILLAFNSLFLFTKSDKEHRTPNKKIRDIIYIVCGLFILIALTVLAICHAILKDTINQYKIALLLETIMLSAFGVSWLVKGETIFKD